MQPSSPQMLQLPGGMHIPPQGVPSPHSIWQHSERVHLERVFAGSLWGGPTNNLHVHGMTLRQQSPVVAFAKERATWPQLQPGSTLLTSLGAQFQQFLQPEGNFDFHDVLSEPGATYTCVNGCGDTFGSLGDLMKHCYPLGEMINFGSTCLLRGRTLCRSNNQLGSPTRCEDEGLHLADNANITDQEVHSCDISSTATSSFATAVCHSVAVFVFLFTKWYCRL